MHRIPAPPTGRRTILPKGPVQYTDSSSSFFTHLLIENPDGSVPAGSSVEQEFSFPDPCPEKRPAGRLYSSPQKDKFTPCSLPLRKGRRKLLQLRTAAEHLSFNAAVLFLIRDSVPGNSELSTRLLPLFISECGRCDKEDRSRTSITFGEYRPESLGPEGEASSSNPDRWLATKCFDFGILTGNSG